MGGDELGINANCIDHGQADNQGGQDEPPQAWRRVPLSRQLPSRDQLGELHGRAIPIADSDAPGNRTTMPRIKTTQQPSPARWRPPGKSRLGVVSLLGRWRSNTHFIAVSYSFRSLP
jgi:hypothetical protein